MARWPALLMSYLIISIVAFSSYMIYTIPETLFINFCLFVTATLKDIRLTIVQIGAEWVVVKRELLTLIFLSVKILVPWTDFRKPSVAGEALDRNHSTSLWGLAVNVPRHSCPMATFINCCLCSILQMVSKLFNGIIFVTLATNVAMLCTALFQLTLVNIRAASG